MIVDRHAPTFGGVTTAGGPMQTLARRRAMSVYGREVDVSRTCLSPLRLSHYLVSSCGRLA